MSDYESDFESDSFEEETEPSPDATALKLTSECPLNADGILVGPSIAEHKWLFTPKMLKKLAAQAMIKLKPPYKLQERYLPSNVYPVLFVEAARMKNDEAVWYLVSTWPFEVLNMNELELPLDSLFGYFTQGKDDIVPLAHSLIRGILYRSRVKCKMKMIILPKLVAHAPELLKTFMRLPVHFLRDLPGVVITELLRKGEYHDGEHFMELITKFETKRPISYSAYRIDKLKLIITVPAAIIHFIGSRQNYDEVIAGLILQRHSPFLFHFEDLAICNSPSTHLTGAVLDRIVNPLGVTKLVLHNKRFYRPDDIVTTVSALSPVLRKFERLHSVFFRISDVLGIKSAPESETTGPFMETFSHWTRLKWISFDKQSLSGRLEMLLRPQPNPLLKLSLVNARLLPDDLRALANSRHAISLQFLRIDENDLHAGLKVFVNELLPTLQSVVVLQTRRCQLTFEDAMAVATGLGCSRTIRSWTLTYNYVHRLDELKTLLGQCSRASSLCEVGCMPADCQKLLGRLFMHNRFLLTDDEKEQLYVFGQNLHINVI